MKICYIAPKRSNCNTNHYNYYGFSKRASFLIATCIVNINILLAKEVDPLKRMDEGGEEVLRVGQRIGYWVCILMCIFEIIKKVKDGDTNAIWGILVKYAIAYGSLFGVKWILDMIGGFFV